MSDAKTVAKSWFERVWQKRERQAIRELGHEKLVGHQPGDRKLGLDDFESFHDALLAALPDFQLEVEEVVGEGDTAVVRWRMQGTHTGEPFGAQPARGNAVTMQGLTWMRCADGRVTEGWDGYDFTGLSARLAADPD